MPQGGAAPKAQSKEAAPAWSHRSWIDGTPRRPIYTLTLFSDVNKYLFFNKQSLLLLSAPGEVKGWWAQKLNLRLDWEGKET